MGLITNLAVNTAQNAAAAGVDALNGGSFSQSFQNRGFVGGTNFSLQNLYNGGYQSQYFGSQQGPMIFGGFDNSGPREFGTASDGFGPIGEWQYFSSYATTGLADFTTLPGLAGDINPLGTSVDVGVQRPVFNGSYSSKYVGSSNKRNHLGPNGSGRWILQGGYEVTAGAQAAGYFKGGAGAIVNLGSIILAQEAGGDLSTNYNLSGNPIFQQEIGASYILGANYKRTLQFDDPIGFLDGGYEWEQHQLSIGALGVFDLTWTWDGNGNLKSFFGGVDLEVQLAAGIGINWNILKSGYYYRY